MRIIKRFLVFVLTLTIGLSFVFLKPVSAQSINYKDSNNQRDFSEILHRPEYEYILRDAKENALSFREYSSDKSIVENLMHPLLFSIDKDIELANVKVLVYQTALDDFYADDSNNSNTNPNYFTQEQELKDNIENEKKKLTELEEKKKKNEIRSKKVRDFTKTYAKAANQILVEVLNVINDPKHIDYGGMTFRVVEKIGVCMLDKYGLGCLLDTYTSWLKNFSGSTTQSQNEQLLNNIEEMIDGIHEQLDEIEKEIKELSKELGKQADSIIGQLSSAIEATSAKERLMEFVSSSSGNFSYNRFKNYVLGSNSSIENPSGFKEAYAAKLTDYINENRTQEEIKSMWDKLYVSLDVATESRRSNIDTFYYDYLLENKDIHTNSIGMDYYTYLSANRNLLNGKTA